MSDIKLACDVAEQVRAIFRQAWQPARRTNQYTS